MSALTASIQWHCEHCGLIRLHPNGGSYEDYSDYDQTVDIVWRGPGTVALEGLSKLRDDKGHFPERWQAIVRAVCAVPGAERMEREGPGGRRRKTLDLAVWRERLGVGNA